MPTSTSSRQRCVLALRARVCHFLLLGSRADTWVCCCVLQELDELNQRLYASRVAKLRELRMAQDEKAALQVKLQDTLAELADSRQTAQQAAASLRNDRQFVKGILRKYQVLVDKFEAQKAKADLSDHDEMETLRRSLAELHQQMNQAKNLSSVLTELERTKIEAGELTNLLKFHKVDLAIVQAGSRQALSKAKAHKDSLFQALVGLERQLVSAKGDREGRLADIASSRVQEKSMTAQVSSEEQEVLEREVAWLQSQVAGTQESIESYSSPGGKQTKSAKDGGESVGWGEGSSRGAKNAASVEDSDGANLGRKVSQRSDLQVKLLKYQVDELERQISEVKMEGMLPAPSPEGFADVHTGTDTGVGPEVSSATVSGGSRRRPTTAGADGTDRRRTASERANKLEASLGQLKSELQRAEQAVEGVEGMEEGGDGEMLSGEGLSEARRISILAHMEAIEKEIHVDEERQVLAGELDWLEGLINEAEKGHASESGNVQGLQRLIEKDAIKVETQTVVTQLAHTRAQLQSALSIADSARGDLAAVLKEAEDKRSAGGEGAGDDVEKLVGIGQALDDALKNVKQQSEQGKKSQDLLSQRLVTSESCVVQQQREILALRGTAMGEGVQEASALRDDNLALENDLQDAMDANNLATGQIRLLEAKLRDRLQAGDEQVAEPEDMPGEEHALRKRLREEQQEGHDCQSGMRIEPSDSAELALIWGMDTTCHLHLLWIPERSLRAALPVGWRESQDRKGEVFYVDVSSGHATYMHPNDVKYHDMLLEIRAQLEPTESDGDTSAPRMNPEVLETERRRLREASAAIERQARQLRKDRDALTKDTLRTTLSVEQQDEHKVLEWEAKKEEEVRGEIARLRENETQQLHQAKEKMLVDVREQVFVFF